MDGRTGRRPKLCEVPLRRVLPLRPGRCYMTMSRHQWDPVLAEAYSQGWVLLEVSAKGRPRRAFASASCN
jgi:hypothetical protein